MNNLFLKNPGEGGHPLYLKMNVVKDIKGSTLSEVASKAIPRSCGIKRSIPFLQPTGQRWLHSLATGVQL